MQKQRPAVVRDTRGGGKSVLSANRSWLHGDALQAQIQCFSYFWGLVTWMASFDGGG